MADFIISSLRGGQNSYDPPTSLPDDQVIAATNTETYGAQIAARRLGSRQINLWAGGITADRMTFMHRHTPTQTEADAELWLFGVYNSETIAFFARKTTTWTFPAISDTLVIANGGQYQVRGLSAHQKLFLAYKSNVDRLHVWDGTVIRRVGLAAPMVPLVATSVGTGAMTGIRYYRYRFITMSGTQILRRSESSPHTSHDAAGAAQVTLTSPTANLGEGETHWELEASVDNVNFYRIAVSLIGVDYGEAIPYANGYAQYGTLSAQSGDYTPPHSAKMLVYDENRILLAGSHEQEALASRISWTVVIGDVSGVGNDERIPIASVNYLDLDPGEGGGITAMSGPVNGAVWVFKRNATYKGVRTGVRTRAYDFISISKTRGALPGSLVEGIDQYGGPALYFLDPEEGPCRITRQNGLHRCGRDIYDIWGRINLDLATAVCRGEFDTVRQQVHWWLAVDGAPIPNHHIVLQTTEMEDGKDGARRGWAVWPGKSAEGVLATCMFASNIDDNAPRNNDLRMFIAGEMVGRVWMTGTGSTDNGTPYLAGIRTKPYLHGNALHQFAVENGVLLGNPLSGGTLVLWIERDFGLEITTFVSINLSPTAGETQIIRPLDNLKGTELRAFQLAFSDPAPLDRDAPGEGRWIINYIAFKEKKGQTS